MSRVTPLNYPYSNEPSICDAFDNTHVQYINDTLHIIRSVIKSQFRERNGSVLECLTRDREAVGLSLTGVTALWSLSKTHLS